MSRQHATPVLIGDEAAVPLAPVALGNGPDQISEAQLQSLIHDHTSLLPIREIDPLFADPIPLCTEMNTRAGPIDNVLITASGLPVLVECKLWRNPEARREVVGQIIDYAKELSRWTASDFQREVSRRVEGSGNPILELLAAAGHVIDEIEFNDALTLNLRRGRFLLLIVGDGIREGVEAIAEYLQGHGGLHFTFGLIELPVFTMPDARRVIVPRVMARTTLIARDVVTVPDGYMVADASMAAVEADCSTALTTEQASRRDFMKDVMSGLVLDDPDQLVPLVSPTGWLSFYMPAPARSCWVSVLDRRGSVGVRLTSNVGTIGEAAIGQVVTESPQLRDELGQSTVIEEMSPGRYRVQDFLTIDRHANDDARSQAVRWLQMRINDYVSIFRPRIRDAVDQMRER